MIVNPLMPENTTIRDIEKYLSEKTGREVSAPGHIME
jgi:hypothetical protein